MGRDRISQAGRLADSIATDIGLWPLMAELRETMTIAALKRGNPRRPQRSKHMDRGTVE